MEISGSTGEDPTPAIDDKTLKLLGNPTRHFSSILHIPHPG